MKGTRYESLLTFWNSTPVLSNQYVAFCPEIKPDALLKMEKRIPELFLMAVMVENRIVKKKDIQDMTKMPTLETLRGELCGILQMPVRKTMSLLQHDSRMLTTNLQQYVKDQGGDTQE